MVSKAGKIMLKNTIQSLQHQNKIKEEKEMWNKWKNEKICKNSKRELSNESLDDNCDKSYQHFNEDKHKSHKRHKSDKNRDQKSNNFWLKKLMEAEEKLSDQRWSHSGFKELYSEELVSSSESNDSEQEIPKKRKKKKHKKHHKKHKNKRKK